MIEIRALEWVRGQIQDLVINNVHGKGGGITMAGQQSEDVATFTGEAVGRISSSGSTKWRGSIFYSTSSSKGKLSFLNNMILVFESEINAEGNFTHKAWEWK